MVQACAYEFALRDGRSVRVTVLLRCCPAEDILNCLRLELFAVSRAGSFSVQRLRDRIATDTARSQLAHAGNDSVLAS